MKLLAFLFFLCAASVCATPLREADAPPKTSQLTLLNREITVFRSTTPNISPSERTRQAILQLQKAGSALSEPGVTVESISINDEKGIRFLAGELYLFSILESDLDALAGETLDETSKQTIANIAEATAAQAERFEPARMIQGAGVVLLASVLLYIATRIIRRLANWLTNKVEKWIQRISRLNIHRADLRPHIIVVAKRLVGLLQTAGVLMLVYVWLTVSLHQFPTTAPWGEALGIKLGEFAAHAGSGMLVALPGIAIVVIILLIARWLARLTDHLIKSLGSAYNSQAIMSPDTARATRRIASGFIWLFAIVISYPYIPGSGSTAFQGLSMLLGLMISLGSSGMINQIMSGFVMLYSGSIRTGEYVKVGELEGTVTEMGMLATKIMTPRRDFISVPNAVLVSNPTYNFSRLADEHGAVVTTSVTIGYDTPWRQVHAMLKMAAIRTEGVREDPEPRVLQVGLHDHYAEYTLVFYIECPSARPSVISELHAQIQDVFNEYGVQIMSPHFKAQPEEDIIIPKSNWFPKPAAAPESP